MEEIAPFNSFDPSNIYICISRGKSYWSLYDSSGFDSLINNYIILTSSYQQHSAPSKSIERAQFGVTISRMGWKPSYMVKNLLSTLSVLYCLLLLAIYIVPLATKLIAPEKNLENYGYNPDYVMDGIHIYMFAVSSLFLLYLIFGLSRGNSSSSYKGSHASAFVRVGAVFFGLGTIGHLGTRLMEDVKALIDENNSCSKTPEILARFLSFLNVLLQISAIILCCRMKVKPGWGVPFLGLMHMVATNLIAWGWAVYEESLHIQHDAVKKELGTCMSGRKGSYDRYHAQDDSGHHGYDDHGLERAKRAADSSSNCQPLSGATEPFFYPFLIEFVLIGGHT